MDNGRLDHNNIVSDSPTINYIWAGPPANVKKPWAHPDLGEIRADTYGPIKMAEKTSRVINFWCLDNYVQDYQDIFKQYYNIRVHCILEYVNNIKPKKLQSNEYINYIIDRARYILFNESQNALKNIRSRMTILNFFRLFLLYTLDNKKGNYVLDTNVVPTEGKEPLFEEHNKGLMPYWSGAVTDASRQIDCGFQYKSIRKIIAPNWFWRGSQFSDCSKLTTWFREKCQSLKIPHFDVGVMYGHSESIELECSLMAYFYYYPTLVKLQTQVLEKVQMYEDYYHVYGLYYSRAYLSAIHTGLSITDNKFGNQNFFHADFDDSKAHIPALNITKLYFNNHYQKHMSGSSHIESLITRNHVPQIQRLTWDNLHSPYETGTSYARINCSKCLKYIDSMINTLKDSNILETPSKQSARIYAYPIIMLADQLYQLTIPSSDDHVCSNVYNKSLVLINRFKAHCRLQPQFDDLVNKIQRIKYTLTVVASEGKVTIFNKENWEDIQGRIKANLEILKQYNDSIDNLKNVYTCQRIEFLCPEEFLFERKISESTFYSEELLTAPVKNKESGKIFEQDDQQCKFYQEGTFYYLPKLQYRILSYLRFILYQKHGVENYK